jgi:hypothetical protein
MLHAPAVPFLVGGVGVWVEPAPAPLRASTPASYREATCHVAVEGRPGKAAALNKTERAIIRRKSVRWRLCAAEPFVGGSVPCSTPRMWVRGWWWWRGRCGTREVGVYPPWRIAQPLFRRHDSGGIHSSFGGGLR